MQQPSRLVRLARLGVFGVLLIGGAREIAAQEPTPAPTPAPPVQRAPIAVRPLARGTVIGASDITYRDTVIRIPTDTSRVAPGWVTRRVIAAGEVLRPPAVAPPTIVQANQGVDIEYADRNVSLTVRGTATRAAAMGERVVVRTQLGRRVEATVVGAGRVRLD